MQARSRLGGEVRGAPLTAGTRQVTPVARVARVRWPGGGFEWQRPVAVEVREGDETRRIPIRDETRRALGGIVLAVVAVVALGTLADRWLRGR
jgi:hypothetical protein